MHRSAHEESLQAMNEAQREAVAARLSARIRTPTAGDGYMREMLRCMVDAGACRIGVRNDRPLAGGIGACDLAPPLARIIDHTALKPETGESDIRALCREAAQHCFASVCVPPCYVRLAVAQLRGTDVRVCTVVGFPHGNTYAEVKAAEAARAVQDGALEVDMVLNVGLLKSGQYDAVESDIRVTVRAAKAAADGVVVKVILECALLSDEEKVIACVLAQNAKADYVKTSTGFASGGATLADVALMRRVVGKGMGIKAAGGVKTRDEAARFVSRGATRIGASASVGIVAGSR